MMSERVRVPAAPSARSGGSSGVPVESWSSVSSSDADDPPSARRPVPPASRRPVSASPSGRRPRISVRSAVSIIVDRSGPIRRELSHGGPPPLSPGSTHAVPTDGSYRVPCYTSTGENLPSKYIRCKIGPAATSRYPLGSGGLDEATARARWLPFGPTETVRPDADPSNRARTTRRATTRTPGGPVRSDSSNPDETGSSDRFSDRYVPFHVERSCGYMSRRTLGGV